MHIYIRLCIAMCFGLDLCTQMTELSNNNPHQMETVKLAFPWFQVSLAIVWKVDRNLILKLKIHTDVCMQMLIYRWVDREI